jgi:RND family efflux transporter MFP subunit
MRQATALLLVGLTLVACGAGERASGQRYHCPMHPTYIADRMGDCPICGMRLVPIEEGDRGPGTGDRERRTSAAAAAGKYVCPMCPGVSSDDPEARCPECGMRLVPREEAGEQGGGHAHATYTCPMHPDVRSDDPEARCPECGMRLVAAGAGADGGAGGGGALPVGMAPVDLGDEGVRLAGVRTEKAVRARLGRSVRAVGTVVPDETRIRHVHTKIAGWVERLHVNFTGQQVLSGEPLLAIFSQELLASQEEYLRAREAAARFAASELPEVRKGGEDLLAAARRRLELLDVPASVIAELERSGRAQRTVTLLAPVSGFVTAKNVVEGHRVEPGMELFTITDLSRVWVEAELYEVEALSLRIGQRASLELSHDRARRFSAAVAFVSPTLDTATRTLRVRFDLTNRDLALKPGMYADVDVELDADDGVVVPDSAVMDTGERQVVFVAHGGGRFAPREVRVGVRSGGRALLLAGVAEGEEVVVRANFLLDSESRLRAALAGVGGHGAPRE